MSTPAAPEILSILNALPRAAILLDRHYRILVANDRYREVYGFSDQPNQQRCYEISHGNSVPCDMAGETCPLKDSLDTGEITQVLHIHHTPRGQEYVNVEMWPISNPTTGEIDYFIEQMHPSDAASTAAEADGRPVGSSRSFLDMLNLVERVARSATNVLLLGESGTGKEVIAQTIHRLSDRAERPFVPVECTGLPESLFESELFGYAKGAFTGATTDKQGLVAGAETGTLFLDEVGEIPLADQVKLLRLLETRRYRKVGSNDWQEADFRLVCATNKNLAQQVTDGTFREDLYYRLNVFEIELPALRDRREDLPVLTETLLARLGAPNVQFSKETMALLQAYDFPGNVRELRNIVERSVLLADDGVVHPRHLPRQCQNPAADVSANARNEQEIVPLDVAERRYLQRALSLHKGPRKELAERLGVSERVLYRKIAELR